MINPDNLPVGVRFTPTDKQLVIYVNKMINNEPPPHDHIHSVNVYQHHPRELADKYPGSGRDEWYWYFFTSRERRYLNGSRPNRATGDGYWKATVADRKIYDNTECIGFKKTLVFYQGNAPNGKKTNWIMHEYTVNQPPRHPDGTMRLDDCVLCRIHERRTASARKCLRTEHQSTDLSWQQDIPEPNQNQPALQYSTMPEVVVHHREQEDYCLPRTLEDIEQSLFDCLLENNNEVYVDLSTGEMVDTGPDDSLIDNDFEQLYLRDLGFNNFTEGRFGTFVLLQY